MIDYASLNENQYEAVFRDKGPLLISAGSGKTWVLSYRIAGLLEKSGGKHFRILALTVTNKAAADIRGTVERLLHREFGRVRTATFHDFAAELLRRHGNHLDIRPDFGILSNDDDRKALLDDVLEEQRRDLSLSRPSRFEAYRLLPAITGLFDRCVPSESAEEVLKRSGIDNAVPLARVYAAYRNALRRANCLDFPALIAECLNLFHKHPFLIKHVRKVYKHILVDEFQNTSHSQCRLLSLIAKPDASTLVVAAEDERIPYRWNDASRKRIQSLENDFDITELRLPESFACPPQVIQMGNALIEKNYGRSAGNKQPEPVLPGGGENIVRVLYFNDLEDEIDWIVRDISEKNPEDRANCAVHAPMRKLSAWVGRKLEDAGIPAYYGAERDEFRSAPLKMLLAILRLANSGEDGRSLAELSRAFFELEGIAIEPSSVMSRASADGMNPLHAWLDAVKRNGAAAKSTHRLLGPDITPLLNTLNYRDFADHLLNWAEGFQTEYPQDENVFDAFETERETWNLILSETARKFPNEAVGLHRLLHEFDLMLTPPSKLPEAVPCLTIHASTAVESDHVYLMGLVEDMLPSRNAVIKGDDSLEMQAERRSCFATITRTRKSLTLTSSKSIFDRQKPPSRFLTEMNIAF